MIAANSLRSRGICSFIRFCRPQKAHNVAMFCCIAAALAGWGLPAAFSQSSIRYIGSVTTVASGLGLAVNTTAVPGIAVDTSGDIYFADEANSRVLKETPSANSYTQTVIANAAANGLLEPVGIAVDLSGNVYIADSGSGQVLKETMSAGSYSQSTVASGLYYMEGISVDGNGNLYIADWENNQVLKETLAGGHYTQSTVASGLSGPVGVAVDGSGDVYIADTGNTRVLKETLAGGYTQTVVANKATNGLNTPYGVAVDQGGNIYIADAVGVVFKETPTSGSYVQTIIPAGPGGDIIPGQTVPSGSVWAEGVAIDGSGSVYILDSKVQRSVFKETASAGSFGAVDVGSNATAYMFFEFTTASLDNTASIAVNNTSPTQGGTAVDFAKGAATLGSCGTNPEGYSTGEICDVAVTFTPALLGQRTGTVVVTDTSTPSSSATASISGIGAAPQIGFLPGNQEYLAGTAAGGVAFRAPSGELLAPDGTGVSAFGVAVDGSGNLYIADSFDRMLLKETLSSGSYVESVIPYTTTPNGGLGPGKVAVDNSGNLYVADAGPGIYKLTPTGGGGYIQTSVAQDAAGSIAVDQSGNIYFTGAGNSGVYKETYASGSYTRSAIIGGSGTTTYQPVGVAVDYSGDVYMADLTTSTIIKETPSAGGYTASVAATLPFRPTSIAIDALNDIYVSVDSISGSVIKLTPSGNGYIQSTLGANLSSFSIALDGGGNVYVAAGAVVEIGTVTVPSLQFGSTPTGSISSDSPQTITVTNSGTGPLLFPVPGSGTNPSVSPNFVLGSSSTCPILIASSSVASLPPGATCSYSVSFSPTTTGSISGALVITDNSLNATNPYATQSISLNGTGTAATSAPSATFSATSLTFPSATVGTTSAAQTITVTNSGTAALALTSIAATGDFKQANTCGASVAAGANCTISVTFTPSAVGTRTGALTIIDNATGSPQTVTLSGTGAAATPGIILSPSSLTFASAAVGTTSTAQTITLSNPGTTALTLTSIATSGDFAQTHTCGTSVAAGSSCTISVTFTPTAAGSRTGTISITDDAAGSPQTVSLSGGGESVALASSVTALTISAPGGSATAGIQVSAVDGFAGSVNITCAVSYQGQGSPNIPPTCSLSPAQVQISGTASGSSNLTVSTTAATAMAKPYDVRPKDTGFILAALIFLGVVPRRRRRLAGLLSAVLFLVVAGGVIGCSGSSSGSSSTTTPVLQSGTTIGNYQVVVTATSGTATASTTVPLSLQ